MNCKKIEYSTPRLINLAIEVNNTSLLISLTGQNSRCYNQKDCDFKTVNEPPNVQNSVKCRMFNTSLCNTEDWSANCGCQAGMFFFAFGFAKFILKK
mgnify:FL=1